MSKFYSLHFNVHELDRPGAEAVPKGLAWTIDALEPGLEQKKLRASVQANDETAARRYIESLLEHHEESALRSLVAPEVPAVMPDLRLEASSESPLTGTRLVKFSQTNRSIPIFGTRAVVEIDAANRGLVAMDADLADVPDVSPLASMSPAQALEAIAKLCAVSLESLQAVSGPEMNFFHHPDQGGPWRLVYHFTNVPAIPPEKRENNKGMRGCVGAPCEVFATYDFLVDANTAEIVFSFATHACITDIPVPCKGVDEMGVNRDFFGRNFGAGFELDDPLRAVRTFDYQFDDIRHQTWPPHPIQHSAADFGTAWTAAISAHCNAQLVFDFYNSVLKRKSIDDKGMAVVSMINCTYAANDPPPVWRNAVWHKGRMWYGQVKDGEKFESYSRYLDVIGHELTHGVTESTANLVYQDQSGALNESFSDIFGIMINNWYPNQPNSISSWNWEIGPNLGDQGPLRDMSNPKRTNDPDHMNDYLKTSSDYGGVHTNSNIHNKAAYNVLTSKDGSAYIFTPVELAILYYLTLCRLGSMDGFSDCLRTLKSVAAIYYSGNTAVRDTRIDAIEVAYDAVGIM
jgi:bacillolysin